MNKEILRSGIQKFITDNLNTNIVSVLLKKINFPEVSTIELVEQLEAKKKCQNKLPSWFSATNIYYPNKLNIEQTSSEITARYKASIVQGKSLIDITGGFGVDCYFFSKKIAEITHCEINQNLSGIVAHNYLALGVKNIKTASEDGIHLLERTSQNFDWIYIDPSRRNEVKGKVFMLSDCLPNAPEHLSLLFKKTSNILIKTSPLLDFSIGIKELRYIKEIHVVAVKNEVKELLWVLEKGYGKSILIKTINIRKPFSDTFDFVFSKEKTTLSSLSLPLQYLYEPNASILKSGAFKIIGNVFKLQKLHEHTHLYTSETLLDFPGRKFKIENVIQYNKKAIQQLKLNKVNITTRNFSESVAVIRKKFKLKDGGDSYLFFTKDMSGKSIIMVCSKVL